MQVLKRDRVVGVMASARDYEAMRKFYANRLQGTLAQNAASQGLTVFSEAPFAELETRIWKPKFDRYISLEARKAILHDARAATLWVEISPELTEHSAGAESRTTMCSSARHWRQRLSGW